MIQLEGRGDFDMVGESQLVSVSDDCNLYVFDLTDRVKITTTEVEMQLNAIATHPYSRSVFAMGGTDK
jgi:hypothetical protein